jgi:hypothetical protein
MPTATITQCVECQTPVRPNKIRCDKCRSVKMDRLLDHRLLSKSGPLGDAALALASRNIREQCA